MKLAGSLNHLLDPGGRWGIPRDQERSGAIALAVSDAVPGMVFARFRWYPTTSFPLLTIGFLGEQAQKVEPDAGEPHMVLQVLGFAWYCELCHHSCARWGKRTTKVCSSCKAAVA